MRLVLSLIAIAALPANATAQSLRPLPELADNAANAYPPARCAGFYQAFMEWAGQERLGQETWQSTDIARQNAILLSAMIAQRESGGELVDQVENTVRDVRNIADLYRDRFEQNYAVSGEILGSDPLILADLEYCAELADEISAALQ